MDLDCAHDDYPVSPLEAIRFTTNRVIKQLAHPPQDGISEHKDWEPYCVIDEAQLEKELSENGGAYTTDVLPLSWAQDYHFCDELDPETTAQYVLVLDALNFCFWPAPGYEYCQLASSLKTHAHEMSADTLAAMTAATLHHWLQPPTPFCNLPDTVYDAKREVTIPLLASRVSALRQIGASLNKSFQGKAVNLILQANHSAAELVTLVTAHFPAFRDSTVFRGMQVFFYKRAQIFVGDLVGAFNGKHLGFFHDMDRVTCFADYRIPQLLREIGVLRYRYVSRIYLE